MNSFDENLSTYRPQATCHVRRVRVNAARRVHRGVLALLVSAAVLISTAPSATATRGTITGLEGPGVIKDSYIVVLDKSVAGPGSPGELVRSVASRLVSQFGGDLEFVYDSVVAGFSVNNLPVQQALWMAEAPAVGYMEPNKRARLADERAVVPQVSDRIGRGQQQGVAEQPLAEWGLARVSHREPGQSSYVYDSSAGSATTVYVIDTGVYAEHSDFEGRASCAADFTGEGCRDGHGHGTHVAGTVGGKTWGVAKKAALIGVKALLNSGNGQVSSIISGLNWVVSDAKPRGIIEQSVINMSIGAPKSAALNSAVDSATHQGVTVVAAAGNDSTDTCTSSPASATHAVTVAASDSADRLASFSNYGGCVDFIAPGVDIRSAGISGPAAAVMMSGTSMASPHVAGLAAYFKARDGLKTPDVVRSTLQENSQLNRVTGLPYSPPTPNYLVYNGSGR